MAITLTPEIVRRFFPSAVAWVTEMERNILQKGISLSPEYKKDAAAVGIAKIDDIRLIMLPNIPLPDDLGLRQLAVQTDLITDRTLGMTFGHGIVFKSGSMTRHLAVHELVHVLQYERFGGIEPFLAEYVKEVAFPPGYPNGPLEKEAEAIAAKVCGAPNRT
jgi:hypothetical protein